MEENKAERAEPPVHRVAELWGVRPAGGERVATRTEKTDWGKVRYALAFLSEGEAKDFADDMAASFNPEKFEVVRIVTGGADGR